MTSQKDTLINVIESISKKLIEAENTLTELDSPAGDADCGSGVRRGFEAVLKVIPELGTLELGDILKKVGFTLAYTIGGTSGAMLGTGFIETGKSIGDKKEPDAADWIRALENALTVIKRRGGNTQVGDKTLVDSLEPAVMAMKGMVNMEQDSEGSQEEKSKGFSYGAESDTKSGISYMTQSPDSYITPSVSSYTTPSVSSSVASQTGSHKDMVPIIEAAAAAAKAGSDKTIEMTARKGRASYLGERSRGHRDPGSLVIVIMFEAALESIKKQT